MSEPSPRPPRRLRSRFFAAIDRVIAPERRPREAAELRRLRMLTGAVLLVLCLTVLTLPHTVMLGQAIQLVTSGATVVSAVVLLASIRAGASSVSIAHILGALLSTVIFISAFGQGGGILGHASIAFTILPVLLTLVVGGAHGWPWCGVSIVACVVLAALTEGDPVRVQSQALMAVVGSIILTGCAYAFDSMRSRALAEANLAREQAEAAARRAEAAAETKSRFLANMSHEIRTPMNGVLGMLRLLLDTELGRTQRDYAQTAHRSGVALLGLLNDILDLSKVEASQMELEHAPLSLRALVQDVVDQVAVLADAKGLPLVVRFAPETPTEVVGDRGRLRQILLNLVSNAIKFTERGQVSIEVEPTSSAEEAGRVRFTVRDTGIGIAEEQQATVFEYFRQVDMSPTRVHEGTGLGLAIVRELTLLMGGDVGLSSTPGEGSAFWFSVPLEVVAGERSEPSTADPTDEPGPGRSDARVLLVEDNIVNQTVARRMLEALGCRVEVAGDGHEAIAKVGAGRYDLVFMDVQMPKMDGLAATAEIRRQQGDGERVPIVAMTAHAMSEDRDRCLAAGMDDYVSKPIGRGDLVEVLRARGLWQSRPR